MKNVDPERPGDVRTVDRDSLMQSLVAHYWAKAQTLERLQVRLGERDRELTLIVNSRRYRYAQFLEKASWCLRHPLRGMPLIAKKLRSLGTRLGRLRPANGVLGRVAQPPPTAPLRRPVPAPHVDVSRTTPEHRVCIVVHQFFDQNGENMFFGGAERYLIELERLLRDLGFRPEVYQSGAGDWARHYGDLRVIGLDTGGDPSRLNEVFHARVPPGALTIYLAFSLAAPRCHPTSIGISHGIYWDQQYESAEDARKEMSGIVEAIEHATTMVSVDTSTINWIRGTRNDLARRFIYIPNFVDLEEFRPSPGSKTPGRVVVLYPRRLYRPRGFWLVRDILPEFIERFPSLEFHFVGKADRPEEAEVRSLVSRYSENVRWYFLPPERMSEAYRVADITLIPTVHSEGTSLSCLEAQASGNAVIATTVGGLPDLVLHEFNGLLIEPTSEDLLEALVRLVNDEDLRRRLGRQANEVAQTFSLERWRKQWARVLAQRAVPPAHWTSGSPPSLSRTKLPVPAGQP